MIRGQRRDNRNRSNADTRLCTQLWCAARRVECKARPKNQRPARRIPAGWLPGISEHRLLARNGERSGSTPHIEPAAINPEKFKGCRVMDSWLYIWWTRRGSISPPPLQLLLLDASNDRRFLRSTDHQIISLCITLLSI